MSAPSKDTLDFLAELSSDFGKKKEERGRPAVKRSAFARDQVANLDSGTMLFISQSISASKNMDWRGPQWRPVARLTYVTEQVCRCCGNTVRFIAGEYVKFRSSRDLATMTKRADACPDLFHYQHLQRVGAEQRDLEDLIEEQQQFVERCPKCISEERTVETLWRNYVATPQEAKLDEQPSDQLIIPGLD